MQYDPKLKSNNCDLELEFHNERNWDFGVGLYDDDLEDFKLIAAKALTHMLAFQTTMVRTKLCGYYTLIPRFTFPNPINSRQILFSRMSPLDSVVYRPKYDVSLPGVNARSEYEPISKTWERFERRGVYQKTPVPLISFFWFTRLTCIGHDLLMAMGQHLEARLKDDDKLPLLFDYTGVYQSSLKEGPEFLLYDQIGRLKMSLDQLMRLNDVDDLYGPLTLKVFELNGYATVNNPKVPVFKFPSPKKKFWRRFQSSSGP